MDVNSLIVLLFSNQWIWIYSTSIHGNISEDVSFIHKMFPVPPSMRATINVDVYYPHKYLYPAPILGIYTQDHENIRRQCTFSSHGQVGNRDLHPQLTRYLDFSRTLRCERMSNTLHCKGSIIVQDFIQRNFSFSFGFKCDSIIYSLKGLVYTISIDQTNEIHCLEQSEDLRCYSYVQYAVFPNLMGQNIEEISFLPLMFECYQHAVELMCNMYMLKCDPESKKITPPCREMCEDYLKGCDSAVRNYMECSYLPSSNGNIPCLNRNVVCSSPHPIVQNGNVSIKWMAERTYTAEFSCNAGFVLEGNSTIVCMYSGEWSSKPPVCLPVAEPATRSEPWVLVAMVVIITVVVYKMKLKGSRKLIKIDEPILIFKRKNDFSPLPRKREFDAFVLYHFDTDDDFVVNHLVPQLEHTRDFKLCIHSRNFTPGRDIIDNIEEAIKDSNSAIIVMSQGFVDSMWCREEFTHCYIENMKDPYFNLFVIMVQPADTLNNKSAYMKTFIANKTYLQVEDPELFTKLADHLEKNSMQAEKDTIDKNKDNDHNNDHTEEQMKEFKLIWQHENH